MRQLVDAAQREEVRRGVVLQNLAGLPQEFIGDLGGLLRAGTAGHGGERRHAGGLRVGVVDVAPQAFAAEDDDQPIFLHRPDEDFDAGDGDFVEFFAEPLADVAGDAAGAAVGDVAGGVDRAEVAADGDVVGAELEIDAEGFQDAAADDEFQRIVTEQAEMPRPAAGGDAGQHRDAQPQRSALGQRVQIRRVGGFEFGFAAGFQRQPAESVADEQHDFGAVLAAELADEVLRIGHGGLSSRSDEFSDASQKRSRHERGLCNKTRFSIRFTRVASQGCRFGMRFVATRDGSYEMFTLPTGEILIRMTAIVAAACYAGRVFIDIAGKRDDSWQRRARGVWTIGALVLALHMRLRFAISTRLEPGRGVGAYAAADAGTCRLRQRRRFDCQLRDAGGMAL